ncbi:MULTISPECIES: DUF1272 domain-containing protein [unclassified Alcanivorax]|jgi:hypothetical protein|uniref:DUF1272 domain-containing protein n=1 Tax=unclassified Alcanivorax TaxID=2638842 RepID=UPI000789E326|nr:MULTISPECIES: DUF1272 domain-containing protein [unclassified Alcanivorax]MEE2602663.1 DUF1272 domain-containing protein [Pseudomonadota bacterium]
MLKMKTQCETCQRLLSAQAEAYICSYECTYCVDCCTVHASRCPNCQGELVRRPRRQEASNEGG